MLQTVGYKFSIARFFHCGVHLQKNAQQTCHPKLFVPFSLSRFAMYFCYNFQTAFSNELIPRRTFCLPSWHALASRFVHSTWLSYSRQALDHLHELQVTHAFTLKIFSYEFSSEYKSFWSYIWKKLKVVLRCPSI